VRGLTVDGLIVILVILTGVVALVAAVAIRKKRSSLDAMEDSARDWARQNGYVPLAATCSGISEDLFMRCTARVANRDEPFGLECSIINGNCVLMRNVRN
jgi:hypothetical protein